jgi:hypothetical protein
MALLLVQAYDALKLACPVTGASSSLSLPSGVTINPARIPSIATLAKGAAIVNSPTRNLLITSSKTLVPLVPITPSSTPSVAATSSGVLTGAYRVAVSYAIKDSAGDIITESPMSALSSAAALSAQQLAITSIPLSGEASVNCRRIYRTLSGGSILFHLSDIDNNTATTLTDNTADASLSILPEVDHATTGPPGTLTTDDYTLRLVVSWKNRLWACSNDPAELDNILYTEDGTVYKWSGSITAYPKGQELNGVMAITPRRDQLGIIKRSGLWQITGDSDANFRIVQLATGKGGCVSRRSVVAVNDSVFWLGLDGVYEWGPSGVHSITDDTVRPWFTTSTYFNRDEFQDSFAKFNPVRNQYELHLCPTGSTNQTSWVAYNLDTKTWLGPHITSLTNFISGTSSETHNGLPRTLVGGSDANVYVYSPTTYHDGTATAIAVDVETPFFSGDAPDIEHYWGEMSVLSKVQAAGTLTITPTVGRLNASAGTAISHTLTTGRQRLRRLGIGALLKLRLQHSTVDQGVTVYGIEVPFHEVGRR